MKNPRRALQIGEKYGTAAVSKSPETAFSLIPDVFHHTGKGFHLAK